MASPGGRTAVVKGRHGCSERRWGARESNQEARLNIVLLPLGVLLILFASVDAFWTAMWVDRSSGPLSSHLTSWAWRGVVRVVGRKRHNLLSVLGPGLLLSVFLIWLLLLWSGWVLVFASGEAPILSTRDQTPPDWVGRIYYVGYSLFTLGNGDFQPNGGVWQIATVLTTASGMVLITLGVTYLLSVIGAVVSKRAFADQVVGLGGTSIELLRHGWSGRDFHALDLPLNSLSMQISTLTHEYLAYPILHYYHPTKANNSPAIALARLDEALTLLRYGVPEHARPNPAVLQSVRSGIESYLRTLESATIDSAPEPPPGPDLERLREFGIPTVPEQEFKEAVMSLADRRRKLLGLVRNDGWEWPDR